jgi:transmembrane sensor
LTDDRPAASEIREDQAIAWLVRLTSGEANGEDWRALEAWLEADPANMLELARLEALWAEFDDKAEALKRGLDAMDAASTVVPLTLRRKVEPSFPSPMRWAAAAAVALMVGGAGLAAFIHAQPTTYQTGRGEIRHIALADGSLIDLNGGSKLAVRYDGHARHVRMDDAEASFDVAKDQARPFLIAAGGEQIRVVGTAFDVTHHDGQVVVTVRRGVVQVARSGANGSLSDVIRVPAGFQLTRQDGVGGAQIKAVDPEDAFAWRGHRLIYHDQTLAFVAADLNRAFGLPIEVRGPARGLKFSGVLVLDDETAVVRRLQAFLPIDVDRSDSEIVLSSHE